MDFLKKLIDFINSLGDDIFDDNAYVMDPEDDEGRQRIIYFNCSF